ncbi:MAG: DUF2520 domain-containing protein [Acidobacteria bacterium]|nr:DUF2520 domain-containing protein [Acidobacteriota bacterium]
MPLPRRACQTQSVAIVGAGRLGTALARALAACGYHVAALVARDVRHARRAATLAGATDAARPLALSAARLEQLPPADLLLITTPDDLVTEVAARLAEVVGTTKRVRVALHASGALSSDALSPLRAHGVAVGSMHPLVAVSDPVAGAESLRAAFYCVEGDRRAVRAARGIVRDLGGQSFSVETRDKALYHAAAVLASGHTVSLFDIAANLLARCGLPEKRACEVLLPLLGSTLENLSTWTPARALTGTFARADAATVRRHLDALKKLPDDEPLAVYALLGRHSLRLAKEGGVADARALDEIARALAAEENKRGG